MTALLIALISIALIAIAIAVAYGVRQMKAPAKDALGLGNALIATLLAAMSLAVSVMSLNDDSGTTQAAEGGGVNLSDVNSGQGLCVYVTGPCTTGTPETTDLAKMPIPDAVKELAAIDGADSNPTGNAPWPFLILGTSDQGAFVRDGYEIDNRRLYGQPVVRDGRPIYVDCKITDGFRADPGAPNKDLLTTWFKIRYPEPGTSGEFWIYGGFAFPVGHNGNVPDCPKNT